LVQHHATRAKYRPDIDGIRAIAVVAVVLFHLEFDFFQGGYVGVDVFFVLSGFLITGLIMSAIDQGAFRFAQFYSRRVRRLIPALLGTVAATTVAAALILLPDDFRAFARSGIAALASVSNFVFFSESGYWDTAAELKPLLHTWSLGVEEQFYMFWPALVVGLVRLRRRLPIGLSLAFISLLGFVLALWMNVVDQAAAFYLFPFRIFQFSLGALIGWLPATNSDREVSARSKDLLLLTGLGLIGYSVVAFGPGTRFPGLYAVPPTLGTMILLGTGLGRNGQGTVGRFVLENRVSVWIGRVSYSMYLVHWPLISLYRYATGLELDVAEQACLAILTVIGTILLHYGIERRFYTRGSGQPTSVRRTSQVGFIARIVALSGVTGLVLTTGWMGNGWTWRYAELQLTTEQIDAGKSARYDLIRRGCALRDLEAAACDLERPIQVLVFGNSHEPDGYNFLAAGYGDDPDLNLVWFGTINRCEGLEAGLHSWVSTNPECQIRLDHLHDELLERLDFVMYASNQPFASNKAVMLEFLRYLKSRNPAIRIITLGGYVNTSTPCARLVNETGATRACADPENVRYFEADPDAYPLSSEIHSVSDVYIDQVGLLCDGRLLSRCRTETKQGVPFSYDEHHFSLEFSLEVGREYAMLHPNLLSLDRAQR
jgi:peptidoglycan/LPS O-acetylase OafA/YrhL